MKEKIRKLIYILAAVTLLISLSVPVFAATGAIPEPQGHYYYDEVGVLTPETKKEVDEINKKLEAQTGAQVIVAAVKDIEGYANIDEYAVKFFEKWKIGSKKEDNGVLIVASISDKQIKIETGYGVEGAITDGEAGRILDQYVIPYFKDENYDMGLRNGFRAVIQRLEDEYGVSVMDGSSLPEDVSDDGGGGSIIRLIILIIILFLILPKGRGPGRRRRRTVFFPGSFGGPRSFGGGSSGGFGGFSGGGGSSGGGGASRGW